MRNSQIASAPNEFVKSTILETVREALACSSDSIAAECHRAKRGSSKMTLILKIDGGDPSVEIDVLDVSCCDG